MVSRWRDEARGLSVWAMARARSRVGSCPRFGWVALALTGVSLALPTAVAAVYPGANGRIAFGIVEHMYGGSDEEEYFITGFRLGLMTEDGRHKRLRANDLRLA